MNTLTEDRFNELTEDLPEDAFRETIPLLMESFEKQRGRTLDAIQIAAMCVGFLEMSATIDSQVTYIGQLQAELEEAKKAPEKGRLWRP